MKKILSLSLVFVLVLSAFVLASCKGTDKDAQNTAPPHSAASETAAPTETPTAAPETEAPTADLNYVGCMNLELMDFSNIMDRNEDTDLFFWDNQIAIDRMKFNPDYNFTAVFIKEVYVKQIVDETETEITADVYVFTSHPNPTFSMSGIGMDFRITVDKQRMVIISYSEPNICDSIYNNRLRPLASNYRREGLTWQEANKKAYEELYAEFADYASNHPRETPQG